jgi:hypothetical protein
MASPVYGKQFIRFAETGLVPDAVALNQFTLVAVDAAVPTEPPTLAQAVGAGEIMGVLQQDVLVVDTDKATTLQRLGTVATSGLLLVAADAANLQAQGDALLVDANGKSSSAGGAVTVASTAPQVRQVVSIGGVDMVLVSFN